MRLLLGGWRLVLRHIAVVIAWIVHAVHRVVHGVLLGEVTRWRLVHVRWTLGIHDRHVRRCLVWRISRRCWLLLLLIFRALLLTLLPFGRCLCLFSLCFGGRHRLDLRWIRPAYLQRIVMGKIVA